MSILAPDTILQNRYRIVGQIGQGGMGAVYEAQHLELKRRVALKQTLLAGQELSNAFRREAQLLANLSHPALPSVIDHFTDPAGQFLVMEFIPGPDLAQMLQDRGAAFPVDDVLAWADQLLDALDYLHTLTPPIIHRDIKPQNLKPRPRGGIVLLDFGLAKGYTPEMTQVTTGGSIMAYTPLYAPWEQVRGQGTTAQSDLYSLGATLHHLLTNQPPVDAATRIDVLRRRPDPLRPVHELRPEVPASISAVIAHALAVDAEDRPASAAAMRTELRRAQQAPLPQPQAQPPADQAGMLQAQNRSVQAVPSPAPRQQNRARVETGRGDVTEIDVPSAAAQPKRRNTRWLWSLVGLVVVLGIVLAVVVTKGAGNGEPTAGPLITNNAPAPVLTTIAQANATLQATATVIPAATMPTAQEAQGGTTATVSEVETVPANGQVSAPTIMEPPVGDNTAPPASSTVSLLVHTFEGHTSDVYSVAFAPDGQMLASASADYSVKLWRASDGVLLRTITSTVGLMSSVAFTPDGKTLASGSSDETVKLWRASDGALLRTFTGHDSFVYAVAFAPDGKTLASGSWDDTVKLWRVSDGTLLRTLASHSEDVYSVAFAPDGETLVSGSTDKTVKLWRVSDGTLLRTITDSDAVYSVAFAPDGETLATTSGNSVKLWHVSDGMLVGTLTGHISGVNSVTFAPDGKTLASGSGDSTIKLWRVSDGMLLRTLEGHAQLVQTVAFAPDGKTLASGSGDDTVKLWRVNEP